jgi:hypothetical protein
VDLKQKGCENIPFGAWKSFAKRRNGAAAASSKRKRVVDVYQHLAAYVKAVLKRKRQAKSAMVQRMFQPARNA